MCGIITTISIGDWMLLIAIGLTVFFSFFVLPMMVRWRDYKEERKKAKNDGS